MYRFEQVDLRSEGKGFQIQKIRRQVPMPEKLDLKALRSTGLLEGETALPKKKGSLAFRVQSNHLHPILISGGCDP
eukprot:1335613-Amorphochlora_amoeboformis.AAC.1